MATGRAGRHSWPEHHLDGEGDQSEPWPSQADDPEASLALGGGGGGGGKARLRGLATPISSGAATINAWFARRKVSPIFLVGKQTTRWEWLISATPIPFTLAARGPRLSTVQGSAMGRWRRQSRRPCIHQGLRPHSTKPISTKSTINSAAQTTGHGPTTMKAMQVAAMRISDGSFHRLFGGSGS